MNPDDTFDKLPDEGPYSPRPGDSVTRLKWKRKMFKLERCTTDYIITAPRKRKKIGTHGNFLLRKTKNLYDFTKNYFLFF